MPCWKPWRLGFDESWKTSEENCQELVPMDLVDSNDMVAVLDELQQVIRKSILIRNGEFLEEAPSHGLANLDRFLIDLNGVWGYLGGRGATRR